MVGHCDLQKNIVLPILSLIGPALPWEAVPLCERPCLFVKGPASPRQNLPLCDRSCLSVRQIILYERPTERPDVSVRCRTYAWEALPLNRRHGDGVRVNIPNNLAYIAHFVNNKKIVWTFSSSLKTTKYILHILNAAHTRQCTTLHIKHTVPTYHFSCRLCTLYTVYKKILV